MNREFSTRQPDFIGEEQFKKYAVMIPFMKQDDTIYVVFEQRADNLKRQPGDICFPGGKLELNESLEECAIRETMEELLVDSSQIKICGPGDIFLSPFNIIVYPYIGRLYNYNGGFSKDEVQRIIKIPLEFFQKNNPEKFESSVKYELPEDFPYALIQGGTKYPWSKGTYNIYFYQYEEFTIWGMTALMLKSAVELLLKYEK